MKIRSFLVSTFALAALAGCSNNDELDNLVPENTANVAYLSLSLSMPQGAGTRETSGPTTDEGTKEESNLTKVLVVGFDDTFKKLGVYTYAPTGDSSSKTPALKVSGDITKLFVVANPTSLMENQVLVASNYTSLNLAMSESVGDLTNVSNFTMVSAGANPNDKGLVDATDYLVKVDMNTSANDAANTAVTNPCPITVDRLVSKVALTKSLNMTTVGGEASITGWLLNCTNKTYLPYSELVAFDGEATAKYRKDTNYLHIAGDKDNTVAISAAFNWLHNNPRPQNWNTIKTGIEYCHENTMEAKGHVVGNVTKMVVMAKFTPIASFNPYGNTTLIIGQSWFRMAGMIYTFEELKKYYEDVNIPQENKEKIDQFTMKVAEKTLADITDIKELEKEDSGYQAATIEGGILEFFSTSDCYYDIHIKHDNRLASGKLGRWGVVRNNSYGINITKISKPGLPYIPDPTDPAIKDPENPKPEDPNDETEAYLSVEIVVNPWTAWSQDVEL